MSSAVSATSSLINGAASVVASISNSRRINSLTTGNMLGADAAASGSSYANSTSPLQIFVRAKKKINDIFQEVEEYVAETATFVEGLSKDSELVTDAEVGTVSGYFAKVSGIKEVLSRDHMKVAFFGRTSNGKSSVINAMLGDKILPAGIGHTTNCFLQVEGDDSPEPFLLTEGSTDRQNVSGIGQLAHALCNNRLGDASLVRIHWPKTRCQLLRDDVVLVDSPGIDVSESLDEWIDRHCLDADVFVLVSNSESTLMNTEKNFFHKVSQRLSKPNIFILQNRWDVAASEPEYLNEVRKQHMERAMGFLCDELKVVEKSVAEQRVFFVSAKEVLQHRLAENGLQPANAVGFAEGFSSRYFEFQDFERKFEECISKTAVVTKFDHHTQRGKNITNELQSVLGSIQDSATSCRETRCAEVRSLKQRLQHTERELDAVTATMKEKICSMVEDVERKVSSALNEEIRRLSVLVEDFNEPFRADPLVLNVYKKTLHSHVEAGLGSNLRARLSSAVALNIESSTQEMTKRMLALLPAEKQQMAKDLLPRREPFEVLYRLNCENLCQDFHEDIQFKFSLGLVSLVKSFMGKASSRLLNANHVENVPRGLTPLTPSNELPPMGMRQDDWSLISKLAVSTVGSQGTMGLALLLGMMFKTVGWRVLCATITLYGALYAYERLTWTSTAQERTFKKQYVQHATRKLRLIVDLTSHNCSHQVQQELSGTFARLCRLVDESRGALQREARATERAAQQLEHTAAASKRLRNKAHYLYRELTVFEETYLTASSGQHH